MRVPESKREKWLTGLGLDGEACSTKDPRTSLARFTADNLVGSIEGSGICASVVVRPGPDASPSVSNSKMEDEAKAAFVRLLRAQAESICPSPKLFEAHGMRRELDFKCYHLQVIVEEFGEGHALRPQRRRGCSLLQGMQLTSPSWTDCPTSQQRVSVGSKAYALSR